MSVAMRKSPVLPKAKFLGVHTDMYEVGLDEWTLSRQVAGSAWKFDWYEQ